VPVVASDSGLVTSLAPSAATQLGGAASAIWKKTPPMQPYANGKQGLVLSLHEMSGFSAQLTIAGLPPQQGSEHAAGVTTGWLLQA
jgi:hypothetical protein